MNRNNSSDIISRALQLADLENSDFISDKEKEALLNESYAMIYQKVISSGDLTFVKTVNVQDGVELPADFYQLTALYTRGHELIGKKNSAQTEGYEIRGNILTLSPSYRASEVIMEYAPKPQYINLKEKKIGCPYPSDVIAGAGKLYAVQTDTGYSIRSIGSETHIDITTDKDLLAVFENGVLFLADNGWTRKEFYDFKDGMTYSFTSIPLIHENKLYVITFSEAAPVVTDIQGNPVLIPVTCEINSNSKIVYHENDDFWAISKDNRLQYNNEAEGEIPTIQSKVYIQDSALYAVTEVNAQLVKIKPSEDGVTIDALKTDCVPVGITSSKYVITRDTFTEVMWLEGLKDDTILDHPSQLFWNMLSYMLAMQFKTKQSANTSQLEALYNRAEAQFFESLTRDDNAMYTMRNYYKPSGLYY